MATINWLGTPAGGTLILNALVASGLVCDRAGVPWAQDFTLAALCVGLVRIGRGDIPDLGWRIVAVLAMLMTGVGGTLVDRQIGTVIVLSSLAVLLEMIQTTKPQKKGP